MFYLISKEQNEISGGRSDPRPAPNVRVFLLKVIFYIYRWDFTSWVPLVSRMCPSDTYRIYKSGPAVRIDSTLIGFEENSWQRGNITFLFLANHSGTLPCSTESDHYFSRLFKTFLSFITAVCTVLLLGFLIINLQVVSSMRLIMKNRPSLLRESR